MQSIEISHKSQEKVAEISEHCQNQFLQISLENYEKVAEIDKTLKDLGN